ncbi:unnamed protein product [Taenia asiatica]|uniref:Uncharacterized protein n=1 Tax=Taenia asiatica TaxID=60517 RepID=A0A0R3VXD5_TAEAS|nr:unnamed protein product [Taenia asiatica]
MSRFQRMHHLNVDDLTCVAGGFYFQVFDWYATPISIVIIASLEVIALSYLYGKFFALFSKAGAKKLFKNAEIMLGPRTKVTRFIWVTIWYIVTPCFTFFIFVTMIMDYTPPKFNNGQPFPPWTAIMGWCLTSVSIIPIPLMAATEIYRNRHDLRNWFRPVNSITNKHILEEIFKEMTYGNDNEVRTAYFAAMDIVRSSSGGKLLVFLQNGGLVALRNLINSCHLQNRGRASFGMALDILEGLLSVNSDVRLYLLRYWDMLLRPVKKTFAHFQRIHGFTDLKAELSLCGRGTEFAELHKHFPHFWLEERDNSQRPLPIYDVGLFSEYLRILEIMVHTAPDSTPTTLKKMFLANKRLDSFHKTIKDLNLKVPPKKADLVFGPRVDFVRQECLSTSLEVVPQLKAYFNLDEDNSKRVDKAEEMDRKKAFKQEDEKSKAPEVATTCFDSIKRIALEPPPKAEPKVPQPNFCQQLDDTNSLATAHTLSHAIPSIVALMNKNPLFFPSVRKLIDPTGKLEDTALKIMKFKPPKIPHKHSEENKNEQKKKEKLSINLRISDINSVYGVELGKILDVCFPRIPSSVSTKATDEVVMPSEQEGGFVPRDTLDMSIINSVESYSCYLNRASIQTVDELARLIVRKALFAILEKPMPDIEGEISELCQDFCEKNGYSRYLLDRLAEAIVDKVLSCLTDPNSPPSVDQTVEDEIKTKITLEDRQETEALQNGGSVQPHGKNTQPMKETRGRQSLEGSETNDPKPMFPALDGVSKLTTSIPQEGSNERGTFQLCMQKDQDAFDEGMRKVLTNVAEQLSAQLEATLNARSSAESKEDEINKQALYVVQRVISNLAIQMSAASAGTCEVVEESGTVERRVISISRRVLSYSGIPPAFRSSNLGVKNRATYIVNRIVLGALKELSKSQNNSNQNALQEEEEEEDDDPIPIVWRPREISLARAIRTGRLAT